MGWRPAASGGRAGKLFMRPIQRRRGRGGVAGRTGEARPGRGKACALGGVELLGRENLLFCANALAQKILEALFSS